MLSSRYLLIPFVLQMLCMAGDELYFHRQRKLTRWERIGHPLDTLTVLLCFGWLLIVLPTTLTIFIYAGLCIFSCLFITKDEFVHQKYCRAGEHWLHALLFILHPLLFICAGLLWYAINQQANSFLVLEGFERAFLIGNTCLIFLFGMYQLLYWNFLWHPVSARK